MRTIPTYRKSGRLFILRVMAVFRQITGGLDYFRLADFQE